MPPTVSIIITTYYRNNYLDNCIQSALNQSYTDIEVIVVDDSGERYAAPVVEDYPVQYIPLDKNHGPCFARNAGLEAASGEYIQLLDDDDQLKPTKIQRQLSLLENHDNAAVAYCGYTNEAGEVTAPRQVDDYLRCCLMFRLPACVTSTMLVSAELMFELFPLPETPGSDDTFWKIEFAKRTKFVSEPEPLVIKGDPENRRMNSEGAVNGMLDVMRQYEELYDEYDDSVLKKAVAQTERFEALFLLQTSGWSSRAAYLCSHALYVDPMPTPWGVFLAIMSPFGMTGVSVGTKLIKRTNAHRLNIR